MKPGWGGGEPCIISHPHHWIYLLVHCIRNWHWDIQYNNGLEPSLSCRNCYRKWVAEVKK